MKQLTVFRVLTFILIPLAALFGFMDIFILLASLANPSFLLFAIAFAGFVAYTIVSMQFLIRGIDNNRRCKPSLRTWIKRTAYISLGMGFFFLLNAVSVFFTSDIALREYLSQFMETQPKMAPMFTVDFLLSMMRGMSWFMLIFGLILVDHTRINFKFLKIYAHLFEPKEPE
jgi:hypothetical protein